MFSLGRTPYPTVPNNAIFNYISSGQRLEKPLLCPDEMLAVASNTSDMHGNRVMLPDNRSHMTTRSHDWRNQHRGVQ